MISMNKSIFIAVIHAMLITKLHIADSKYVHFMNQTSMLTLRDFVTFHNHENGEKIIIANIRCQNTFRKYILKQ